MHAITVANVTKRFKDLAIPKQTTLKETAVKYLWGKPSRRRQIEAVSQVSFTVAPGQVLGVVGRNGSGKTTLLRLLAGVYAPDRGSITINGTMAPLLAIGAGFHPDFTGRENARIELLVLGFSPKQIDERMAEIVRFSEIGEFIDAPLRTYSTGMIMRLAFAAAVSVDPDVLLLDEVLAVGDAAFSEKCLAVIDDFRARGKTIVLVTHNSQMVRDRCDVAMWLDRGKIAAFGDPVEVTEAYDQMATLPEGIAETLGIRRTPLRTIVVYGNCQAEALFNLMEKDPVVRSLFRVVYHCNFEAPPGLARPPIPAEDVAGCALLFSQHGPDPFPLEDQLPADCVTVRFPSVDFNLLWPFNCVNPYNRVEAPQFPWGRFPYGDRIILGALERGIPPSEILEYYLTGWQSYKPDLNRLARLERARLDARDSHCDVKMTPWVIERFRSRRLFWAVNHPAQIVLSEMVGRLFAQAADVEPALQNADLEETSRIYFPAGEQLSIANIPIHPAVAEELQLEWYDPNQRFDVFGRTYSYEEYFKQMIDYCAAGRAAAQIAASA